MIRARPSGLRRRFSAARRQRIEAAVEAARGQRLAQPYEARIAADPFPGRRLGARHRAAGLSKGRSRSRAMKRPSAS
jgi:hypothetical protein